jgi:hypothetical protein
LKPLSATPALRTVELNVTEPSIDLRPVPDGTVIDG